MSTGEDVVSVVGWMYIISAGLWAVLFAAEGDPWTKIGLESLLIAIPGAMILYGGRRSSDSDLDLAAYPQIGVWTLGGFGVMLGVLAVVEGVPAGGLDRPIFSGLLATGLGSVAGFGVGRDKARTVSRAREAEQHRAKVERQRDALREERNLRERIIEASPIGITILDPDGSVRMANERAARITGLSVPELEALDRYDGMFQTPDVEETPIGEGMFREVLETGEAVYDLERQVTRADGKRIWLSLNGAPIRDSSGDVTAVVVTFEDITEQVERKRQLEASNERLEQFAYAASHDLQEPLRMVSSYLQLIERRYGDVLDKDGREFLAYAVDGSDRMQSMIESLLEYSRVAAGGEPLEPIDAGAVLDDVLDDLHLQVEETDATVTADDLPTVTADGDQLAHVFQNLLANALKYSGDEPPQVHVGVDRLADGWRFSVADEGIGIEPEHQDRIFEVFESLPAGADETGAGIGLALCDRIVERHGGEMWVDSEPGEGTTVYFTVPETEGTPDSVDGVAQRAGGVPNRSGESP